MGRVALPLPLDADEVRAALVAAPEDPQADDDADGAVDANEEVRPELSLILRIFLLPLDGVYSFYHLQDVVCF